ncbi:MAG: DUF320 domain-containing protein, partial [Kutzneria sp.]|nr:DUF320 domain-containing protein [Kutzneria sp.]
AVGLLSNAAAGTNSVIDCDVQSPTVTDGSRDNLAGNVIGVGGALPVQIDNNALGVLATATAAGTSQASAMAMTTPVITSGEHGTLAGNIVAAALAMPVQITGNGAGVLGNANAESVSSSEAASGGVLHTNGDSSTLGGNVLGLPLGMPVEINGNGLAACGSGDGKSATTVDALAGDNSDLGYIHTSGKKGTLAGNFGQTPMSLPVVLDNNAGAAVGNATAAGLTDNSVESGGTASTTGEKSTASGNVLDPEVALPVEFFGNGGAAVGDAEAAAANKVGAVAGGDTYTNGNDSVLGANDAVVPVAGAVDGFGSGGAALGTATGVAGNASKVHDGGYNGTLGNNAIGGGNLAGVPVALPVEGFGLAGGAAGGAQGTAQEIKDVTAGGTFNTVDDRGVISSNLAAVPVSLPAQAFGDAGGAIANVRAAADSDTTSTAATETHANGAKGSISGNLAQVPVSLPTQAFGNAGNVVGNGDAVAMGQTASSAGGPASTTGKGGSIAGNLIDTPIAGAVQGHGNAGAAPGLDNAAATNLTSTTAGGSDTTDGDHGSISGNAATVPVNPITDAFGNAGSIGGQATALADNKVFAKSGDDLSTHGNSSGISGNAATVPAPVTAIAAGNAGTVGGLADAVAKNYTASVAGGDTTTSGTLGSISGNVASVPAPVEAILSGHAAAVGGNPTADSTGWTGNIAGGNTATDGHFGSIAGNVAQVPAVVDTQVPADALGVGGTAFAKNAMQQINFAGGDTTTSGLGGSMSGDIVSVPAAVNTEVLHDVAGVTGNAFQAGANKTIDRAGGDVFTNGTAGSTSGDIIQVPAVVLAQVFGDAVSVAGMSGTGEANATDAVVGGAYGTAGSNQQLSGVNSQAPINVVVQIVNVPVELGGKAVTNELNMTSASTNGESGLYLPVTGEGLMGAGELPSLRTLPQPRSETPGLGGLGLGGIKLPGFNGTLPVGGAHERSMNDLPPLPGLAGVQLPGLPAQSERDLPSLSGQLVPADAHLAQLPSADGVKVGAVPGLGGKTAGL